jgi:hypothetical protein
MYDRPKLGESIILKMMLPGVIVDAIGAGIFAFVFVADFVWQILSGIVGGTLVVVTTIVLIGEFWMQKQLLDLHIREIEARLPRRVEPATSAKPQSALEPQDGGKTPTPKFLERLFYHARERRGEVPSLSQMKIYMGGMDENECQAMFTRLVTWRVIIGRKAKGASGQIAENATHEGARAQMAKERPEYAEWQVIE